MAGFEHAPFFTRLAFKLLLMGLLLMTSQGSFLVANHIPSKGKPDLDRLAHTVGALIPIGFLCLLVAEVLLFCIVFFRELRGGGKTLKIVVAVLALAGGGGTIAGVVTWRCLVRAVDERYAMTLYYTFAPTAVTCGAIFACMAAVCLFLEVTDIIACITIRRNSGIQPLDQPNYGTDNTDSKV